MERKRKGEMEEICLALPPLLQPPPGSPRTDPMSLHLLPIGVTPTPGVPPLLTEVANDLLIFLIDVRFSELPSRAPPRPNLKRGGA